MADTLGMGLQGVNQAVRVGWYFGLNQLVGWQASRNGAAMDAGSTTSAPRKPAPTSREILADLAQLMLRDATAVREGIYPPSENAAGPVEHLARARSMLADLPSTVRRREARDATTSRSTVPVDGLPSYYTQDFHFQTGGYLTEQSARLYDVQVETLFLGGAGPMRREALRPIARFMRGRDQRQVALLDVACGTGRFLRDCRLAWPAMRLTGVDLSGAYVDEARRHMRGLRPAELVTANAETMPIAASSQDIVVSIFLFHELPPDVRRTVASEMARVLKPGGMLVFIDSLQLGDRATWDGLLEAFPVRFHEPYYRHYIQDDLGQIFSLAGLVADSSWTSFFSKVIVQRKPG